MFTYCVELKGLVLTIGKWIEHDRNNMTGM